MTQSRSLQTQSFQRLCDQGDLFPDLASVTSPLEGHSYEHPRKGHQPVLMNQPALQSTGRVYSGDPELNRTLSGRGIASAPLSEALCVVRRHLSDHRLVWGFSGFATAGYGYSSEAQSLVRLHDYLQQAGMPPSLVSDGGVSAGVLGLSGYVAQSYDLPTLGFIPIQGLGSVGPRDHLVVWGITYRDREVLVGTLPDILVCIGGSDGTRRECEVALSLGSTVMLLAPKDYGPGSLTEAPDTIMGAGPAQRDGRLLICRAVDDIPTVTAAALQQAQRSSLAMRPRRLQALEQLLV